MSYTQWMFRQALKMLHLSHLIYEVFEQALILLPDQESIKFLEFAAENTHSSDNWSLKPHGCAWESIVTPKDEMFVRDVR